jgi:hypothetical protein
MFLYKGERPRSAGTRRKIMSSEKDKVESSVASDGSPVMTDESAVYRVEVSINFLVRGESEAAVLAAVMDYVQAPYCCSKVAGVTSRNVDVSNHGGNIAALSGGTLVMVAAVPSDTLLDD